MMSKTVFWAGAGAITAVTILGGFLTAQAQKPAPPFSDRTTILSGDAARPLFKQCSRPSPEAVSAYWTPTRADVQAADALLPGFLKKPSPAPRFPRNPRSVTGDYHQYAGFVRQGRRMLYLNGFAPSIKDDMNHSATPGRKPFDWKRQAVGVCDGGDYFWGAEYDVQTKQWSHLYFNGPG